MAMIDRVSKVGKIKFYMEHTVPFLGVSKDVLEADLVIMGVPYDYTSTFRPGSRFAPNSIREASMNIEAYSSTKRRSCERLDVSDIGNLIISNNIDETLNLIGKVVSYLKELEKVVVTIGGEHTITKGCISQLMGEDGGLLCFDAHLDLRDEFHCTRLNHATFMRRVMEEMRPERAMFIGVRASSQEELDYASKVGIKIISAKKFSSLNLASLEEIVQRTMGNRPLYISIDFDVVDPSFAPAVGNPEPNGINPLKLIDLLAGISMGNEVVGADLVEVSPKYDEGGTAILAAKVVMELISTIRASRSSSTSL
ncbi:MAG: agmatinase [Candidatus Bathyarchaeia archaeon]